MDCNENNSKNVRRRLLSEMEQGIFSECDRLPRETMLSSQLGISRTQLRDVLSELEREGFVTRRHGVGTVINRHVLQVKNRMDIETEFLEIIRQNGYEPALSLVQLKDELADTYLAEKLQVPVGTEVKRICRVCTADGKPAIYCEDVVAKRLIKGAYSDQDLEAPIFYFLKEFCGIDVCMDLTQLNAVAAEELVAEILEIPEGSPLLNMEELDYDIEGNIIFYSNQYFVGGLFEHTVLRKKL